MFLSCHALKTIDLSGLNTKNVTSLMRCFAGSGIVSIDLSVLDTANVTNMSWMLNTCYSLVDVTISGLNTGKLRDVTGMFAECSKLESLDLSEFDTSNVTTMSYLFATTGFRSIGNGGLDLKTLDMTNCQQAEGLFVNSDSLESIYLPEWTLPKVESCYHMFSNCSNLRAVNLADFSAPQCLSYDEMFYRDTMLETVNLQNWDFSKASGILDMFDGCTSLTTVTGPVYGIKKTINLYRCPLTVESAMVFINGLANVDTATTITFKTSTYEQLTPEQIAIASAKGWTVASAY